MGTKGILQDKKQLSLEDVTFSKMNFSLSLDVINWKSELLSVSYILKGVYYYITNGISLKFINL